MFGRRKTGSEPENKADIDFQENTAKNDETIIVGGDSSAMDETDAAIEHLDNAADAPESESREMIAVSNSTDLASLDLGKNINGLEVQEIEYSKSKNLETTDFLRARQRIIDELLDQVDFNALGRFAKDVKRKKLTEVVEKKIGMQKVPFNSAQHQLLLTQIIDEVLGFGPLEPLIADAEISDILVNTHKNVYVEKQGLIYKTDISFESEKHLLNTIQKIVSEVGRRVDESSPMVDARMPDGSRFNAIVPPLALDGCLVSIRKFKATKMSLADYVDYGSMSPEMCKFLQICANISLNVIISGGTGSGKTTLLNALSGHIEHSERIVTIEDAAELQLMQPHVLRLETRPPSTEGTGEVTQRQLVKNALRMRPDRIILGEIRGDEVVDVLSAMNTGHDGSMATIHANTPRDSLSRLENLVGMSGVQIPIKSLRQQIASAVNLIVQIERMRDGVRRITHIEEVVGMEGDTIVTQTLFGCKLGQMGEDGKFKAEYTSSGFRPRFADKAEQYGLDKELLRCIQS